MPVGVGEPDCIDKVRNCVHRAPEQQVVSQLLVHLQLLVYGEELSEEGGSQHCEEAASHCEWEHRNNDLRSMAETVENASSYLVSSHVI